jgi:hypothetical protein
MKLRAAERHLIDNCPIPAGIKDENSRYLYVNQAYADIVGVKNPRDLIGLTVKDLPTTSSRSSNEYNEQDVQVMRLGKHLPAYCIYRKGSEENIKVYRYVKYPFKDYSGKTVGIYFYTEDFTTKTAANIGAILYSKNKTGSIENIRKITSLNTKMQDVYAGLGKCSKEIAIALGVSVRTVEGYLEFLKNELGVYNKYDLIAFGAIARVPDDLLRSDA